MSDVTSRQLLPGLRVAWQVAPVDPDAADRLLAAEVARMLGCGDEEARIGRSCPHCGSAQHGRPVVLHRHRPVPSVSLSRAPGVALVAVSRGRLVGVDIEKLDAAGPMARRDAVLHPDERARDTEELTTTWVRKESLLKATGDGLRVDPAEIRLSDPDEEPRLLEWAGDRVLAATWMADLRIDGFTACVTVLADRIDLSSRPAAPAALSR